MPQHLISIADPPDGQLDDAVHIFARFKAFPDRPLRT